MPHSSSPSFRRLGVVSAFPPGRNSLNEFGWHMVRSFAAKPEIGQVVLFADRTDAGPPTPVDGVLPVVCWRFNSLANVARIVKAVRRERPDALIFNLQFATFGDRRVAGGLGLLAPACTALMGVPTAVVLHNLVENVDMRDAGFASSKVTAKLMSFAGRALTRMLLRADYVAVTIPKYVDVPAGGWLPAVHSGRVSSNGSRWASLTRPPRGSVRRRGSALTSHRRCAGMPGCGSMI